MVYRIARNWPLLGTRRGVESVPVTTVLIYALYRVDAVNRFAVIQIISHDHVAII